MQWANQDSDCLSPSNTHSTKTTTVLRHYLLHTYTVTLISQVGRRELRLPAAIGSGVQTNVGVCLLYIHVRIVNREKIVCFKILQLQVLRRVCKRFLRKWISYVDLQLRARRTCMCAIFGTHYKSNLATFYLRTFFHDLQYMPEAQATPPPPHSLQCLLASQLHL